VDYAQLRLDWMRQRADLAAAQVNLQLAEAELRRTEELFKSKVASESALDTARASYGALQRQVAELQKLVAEGEQNFSNLQPGNGADISRISDEPMRAAIAVQEAKLRQTEAELSPLLLRAPLDGVVTTIYHRSGEAVTAGQPILTIASTASARIVGYLRAPFRAEPKPGDRVQVRTRNLRREAGVAQIVGVGAQLEPVPAALQSTFRLAGAELALPVDISMPPNLRIRPGELVDIILVSKAN
jgi:HlyD family secretion protein